MRILVIEAVELLRTVIRRALEGAGHEVFAVGSLDEARTEVRGRAFALAILDAAAGPGKGPAACATLRADSREHDLRIVLLVESQPVGQEVSLDADGPDAFLVKPITPAKLPAWLESMHEDIFAPRSGYLGSNPPARPEPEGDPAAASRIGVVDPSEFYRAVIRHTLGEAGLEVVGWDRAAGVREGLAATPCVCLMIELQLPDRPGEELCAELATAGEGRATSLILMGRRPDKILELITRRVGATRHLMKPFASIALMDWFRVNGGALLGERRDFPRLRPQGPGDVALPPDVVDFLRQGLAAGDVDARLLACHELGRSRSQDAVDPLVDALRDAEAEVRAEAAGALGWIGGAKVLGILLSLLEEEEGLVRRRAFEAIGLSGNERALEPLLFYLESDQPEMVIGALRALARIGGERVPPALEGLVQHPDERVRANATWALRFVHGHD